MTLVDHTVHLGGVQKMCLLSFGFVRFLVAYGTRTPIVHSFSSVAYVWVRGAKTTGPIAKKFGFSQI
jgi:hypothetical protein